MSDSKTRNQSIFNYMETLQLEYIVEEIRKKTYPFTNDKKYHERVMGFKKEKIQDISERNNLKTLFSDETVKSNLYQKIIKDWCLPAYIYRNDTEKRKFRKWDVINYYQVHSEVKVRWEDDELIGTIIDNKNVRDVYFEQESDVDATINVVTVKIRNSDEERIVLLENVTRIL